MMAGKGRCNAPLKVAVPAEKSPLPSRLTMALGTFAAFAAFAALTPLATLSADSRDHRGPLRPGHLAQQQAGEIRGVGCREGVGNDADNSRGVRPLGVD